MSRHNLFEKIKKNKLNPQPLDPHCTKITVTYPVSHTQKINK